MSIDQLLTRPCQLVQVGADAGVSDDGVPEQAASATVDTVCELQQVAASEIDLERVEVTDWHIFLPASVTPTGGDHVIVDGSSYELTGEPAPVYSPRLRRRSHWEAFARRVA